jgi:hypothetical protein
VRKEFRDSYSGWHAAIYRLMCFANRCRIVPLEETDKYPWLPEALGMELLVRTEPNPLVETE